MGAYQDLLGRGRLSERVPLSGFTTYRFGGPARFFVEAESEEDVVDAGRLAADEGVEVVALGRGSNLVFADRGFDGVVIHTGVGLAGIEVSADSGMRRLSKGDLLFFGQKATAERPERITHVAIFLQDKQFIHTPGGSGVRIDSFDPAAPNFNDGLLKSFVRVRRVIGQPTTRVQP